MPLVRYNIKTADKKQALLAARKLRQMFEDRGIAIVRGEYIRNDGRVYLDAAGEMGVTDEEIQSYLGNDVILESEQIGESEPVEECLNCGNVPESPFTKCPNCGFQEISQCPSCGEGIPRTGYIPAGGNLFQCPHCRSLVRLAYNEPLWLDEGHYNEPPIVVSSASGS